MNTYFNIKDSLYDITKKYPETLDIFVSSGFEQMKNEEMRRTLGKTLSLEMALMSKKINTDLFINKLIEVIKENRSLTDESLSTLKRSKAADIRIDGVLPCPVRIPLMENFNKWMEEEQDKFDFTVDYELKAASSGIDWIKNAVEKAENEDCLSDIFISAGFDLFFDKKLMGKFKSKGVFEDITNFQELNRDFQNKEINLRDPDSQYSIIGVVPAVFLINKEELKDSEMPRSWEDILKPEFENRVSLPISDFDLFNAILLNIYKNHGEDGIKRLGKSLLKSMHPSEMVKSHMKRVDRPAITIMPYFFTKMVKENGPMTAVWPSDGAIISPIFLLTKKSKKDKTKPFVDFFASKEVGEILSHNGRFPSTNPDVNNNLDKEKKFMWLGWDYINSNDIGNLIKECERLFNESI
ncbi:ABC transporter substrate-binding protein [Tissierella sp. MSJ-40]|uniref:ABC transporter substrate-binding protein n=1 Tax=Tissierella simiarum TaxID=2841534 RepID=A0ABS6E9K6_9FIRM|nr:ABC transporter substrate-binding protein [Tissierella simiarum]